MQKCWKGLLGTFIGMKIVLIPCYVQFCFQLKFSCFSLCKEITSPSHVRVVFSLEEFLKRSSESREKVKEQHARIEISCEWQNAWGEKGDIVCHVMWWEDFGSLVFSHQPPAALSALEMWESRGVKGGAQLPCGWPTSEDMNKWLHVQDIKKA